MEIIKKGRDQTGWTKAFTCTGKGNGGGGCEAILLVSEGDLYQTSKHYYDGESDYFTTFRCPCCKVQTDVQVPSNIKIRKAEM